MTHSKVTYGSGTLAGSPTRVRRTCSWSGLVWSTRVRVGGFVMTIRASANWTRPSTSVAASAFGAACRPSRDGTSPWPLRAPLRQAAWVPCRRHRDSRLVWQTPLVLWEDEDATPRERAEALAALGTLPFPPLGPVGWDRCGRAVYSCTYGHGQYQSLGLSHQRQSQMEVDHLSVAVTKRQEAEQRGSDLEQVVAGLVRSLIVARGTQPGPEQEQVVEVEGVPQAFRRVVMSDGDWVAAGEFDGLRVTLTATPWPAEGFRLVRVDATRYSEATLLRYWR